MRHLYRVLIQWIKGKFITRLLKRNASILAPLVLQQAKYQAGVAELVLEDCVQGKFIYDAFCQGQPSPSPSWAELALNLHNPTTHLQPPPLWKQIKMLINVTKCKCLNLSTNTNVIKCHQIQMLTNINVNKC